MVKVRKRKYFCEWIFLETKVERTVTRNHAPNITYFKPLEVREIYFRNKYNFNFYITISVLLRCV